MVLYSWQLSLVEKWEAEKEMRFAQSSFEVSCSSAIHSKSYYSHRVRTKSEDVYQVRQSYLPAVPLLVRPFASSELGTSSKTSSPPES